MNLDFYTVNEILTNVVKTFGWTGVVYTTRTACVLLSRRLRITHRWQWCWPCCWFRPDQFHTSTLHCRWQGTQPGWSRRTDMDVPARERSWVKRKTVSLVWRQWWHSAYLPILRPLHHSPPGLFLLLTAHRETLKLEELRSVRDDRQSDFRRDEGEGTEGKEADVKLCVTVLSLLFCSVTVLLPSRKHYPLTQHNTHTLFAPADCRD